MAAWAQLTSLPLPGFITAVLDHRIRYGCRTVGIAMFWARNLEEARAKAISNLDPYHARLAKYRSGLHPSLAKEHKLVPRWIIKDAMQHAPGARRVSLFCYYAKLTQA